MTTHGPQSPLLAGTTTSKTSRDSANPSPFPKHLVTTLSVLKVVFGLGLITVPGLLTKVFLLDAIPAQTGVICRLYGSACIAFGCLTWLLNRSHTLGKVDKELLKQTVVLNIVNDCLDVISCIIGYFTGHYGLDTLALLGGGCFALEVLGLMAYGTF